MLAGLVETESGTITLGGVVVDDGRRALPPERRRVGLVFQEHALFPHLDVADNIAFGVRDGDRAGAGWPRCSRSSGSPTTAPATRTSCRAASASASPSPGPSRRGRR